MSPSISDSNAESPAFAAQRRRGRLIALALLAVSAAPVIAAVVVFFFWMPSSRTNYGELIAPRKLPEVAMERLDGRPFRLAELKGKWLLVAAAGGKCDAGCVKRLFLTRQVRLMQGREMDRIERLWLVTDAERTPSDLLASHDGLHVVRATPEQLGAILQSADAGEHIWLIDPLGNLMLRFPVNPDPKGMRNDISRLLKASRSG